jgi:hypothetical protein
MKKVTQQRFEEEAVYFCDKHPERECFSQLKLISWYGSKFDMNHAEVHLCDECVIEMYDCIQQKFGITPKELEL